jgi:colanic acid/amylovoran biosynthesis glycosyltransferase
LTDVRVAFLVSTFPKLSETFIINQVTGLIDAGHNLTIFAQRRPDTKKRHSVVDEYDLIDRTIYTNSPESYSDALSTVADLLVEYPTTAMDVFNSVRRGKSGGERLANLHTLLGYSDMSEFDVVHGHFGTTCRSFDFLLTDDRFAVGEDVPFVSSFYGYDVSEVLRSNPDAYADLFPLCDAVTALSDDMAKKLSNAGCAETRIFKQQLAINANDYQFQPRERGDESLRLLTVARLVEKKGLSDAVAAVSRLSNEYDIKYRIAGDGPLRGRIERQIERQEVTESVEILGWVEQDVVARELSDAHLFVLPSVTAPDGDEEGTPTVLLEAQASGLPVLSTLHAGIPEIVDDGGSGLLVPEGDVDALTDGLRSLIESPEDWPTMGRRGRELVESTHTIPVMTERLEQIYREVTSGEGVD